MQTGELGGKKGNFLVQNGPKWYFSDIIAQELYKPNENHIYMSFHDLLGYIGIIYIKNGSEKLPHWWKPYMNGIAQLGYVGKGDKRWKYEIIINIWC